MELVGYWTSHKEIQDIYHSVYLLRRSLGLPPCGSKQRGRAIHDILSSLRSQLHQWVYPTTVGEAQGPMDGCLSRLSRRQSYEEAIRAACQRVLETAEVLRSDLKRLSQVMRDVPWTHSRSHSRSCSRNCIGSHGRSHSRSHPWRCDFNRWLRSPSRSWQGRRVTFWEPEVEPDPEEGEENYPLEPSIVDVEMWLDWQACQLSMPLLMPEDCSIGQRNSIWQRAQTSTPWWEVS